MKTATNYTQQMRKLLRLWRDSGDIFGLKAKIVIVANANKFMRFSTVLLHSNKQQIFDDAKTSSHLRSFHALIICDMHLEFVAFYSGNKLSTFLRADFVCSIWKCSKLHLNHKMRLCFVTGNFTRFQLFWLSEFCSEEIAWNAKILNQG